jgi:hypothetical protein
MVLVEIVQAVNMINYIQGEKYTVKDDNWYNRNANYNIQITYADSNKTSFIASLKSAKSVAIFNNDTLPLKSEMDNKFVRISFLSKNINLIKTNATYIKLCYYFEPKHA